MNITRIIGREIYDSRGRPTVECDLMLENGVWVKASVPSGTSVGSKEACELRDGGDRLLGQGVLKAVENIEQTIAPAFLGKEPDITLMDSILIQLDGTDNKEYLGANAMLAVSMAICKAQALIHEQQLYEFIADISDTEMMSLPFPQFNIISGGAHANNGNPVQEIMLVPIGAQNFRQSLELATTVFYKLKELLGKAGKSVYIGDEGGFVCQFKTDTEPFDFLMKALEQTGQQDTFSLAIDVAASQLYDKEKDAYKWRETYRSRDELFEFYKGLVNKYPLYSIEDGLHENDWDGWKDMYTKFAQDVQIVGDDIFVTDPKLIGRGIENSVANAAVIKPNQIGTVTETLQAISLCQKYNMNIIISHRSGETNETFIADLAVGSHAGQIKSGGCFRGERLAKYNRLLEIEDNLTLSMLAAMF